MNLGNSLTNLGRAHSAFDARNTSVNWAVQYFNLSYLQAERPVWDHSGLAGVEALQA